ncbi:hypothetical protein Tco_0061761 [Tanacetum coccineum]
MESKGGRSGGDDSVRINVSNLVCDVFVSIRKRGSRKVDLSNVVLAGQHTLPKNAFRALQDDELALWFKLFYAFELGNLKKDDELVEMGDLNVSDINVAGMVNEAATVTGMKHNSTGVDTTIFGMSITSKEVRLGLVEKIEASALDDVIYGLTTAERETTHALILDLERGFNYLNSDSDYTPMRNRTGILLLIRVLTPRS